MMDDDIQEYYEPAKAVLTEIGRVSPSALQRRLRIGFIRATRIIEQMEADGFVTAEKPDHTRDLVNQQNQGEKCKT